MASEFVSSEDMKRELQQHDAVADESSPAPAGRPLRGQQGSSESKSKASDAAKLQRTKHASAGNLPEHGDMQSNTIPEVSVDAHDGGEPTGSRTTGGPDKFDQKVLSQRNTLNEKEDPTTPTGTQTEHTQVGPSIRAENRPS